MVLEEYLWVVVLGFIMAFWDSYGIGANDVANAFATSVSSKALTLKQAVMIACVTEFSGAALLGGATTQAIKGVVRGEFFQDRPELLMLVMLSSLFGSSIWVIFASGRGWPVSTTHATVGGLGGAALVAYGTPALKWGLGEKSSVLQIVVAWCSSPIVAGCVAAVIFLANKFLVLRRPNSFRLAAYAVTFWFALAAFIKTQFLVAKAPGLKELKIPGHMVFVYAGIASAIMGMWAFFFYSPWVRRVVDKNEDMKWYHLFYTPACGEQPVRRDPSLVEEGRLKLSDTILDEDCEENKPKTLLRKVKKKVFKGVNKDVVNHEGDAKVQEIHAFAEKFDPKTEQFFEYLQVFTAMLNSFAHGSNDVANAIGPISTIWSIYRSGEFNEKVETPLWILMYGGIAINIGLVTYGYHVMSKLGNKITYQTPSRGFCTELGTSLTVLTASRLGLPVSTTHSLVGATTGVGIASNGSLKAINWKVLAEVFLSWTITLPAAGLVSAAIFGFGAHAPNL